MSKRVFRTCPYEMWEIDAIEGWLDDMARQGLILESIDLGLFAFEKTTPRAIRYRVDVRPETASESSRHPEEYQAFGWTYVAELERRYGRHLDIFCAEDAGAVELNTDEETLRQALEASLRTPKRVLLTGIVCVAAYIASLCIALAAKGTWRYLVTLESYDFAPLQLALMGCLFIPSLIGSSLSYRRIQRRSLLERTHHTPERARQRKRERWALRILRLVLLAVVLGQIHRMAAPHKPTALEGEPYTGVTIQALLPEMAPPLTEGANPETWAHESIFSDKVSFYQKDRDGADYAVNVYAVCWEWLAKGYMRDMERLAGAAPVEHGTYDEARFYTGTPYGYYTTAENRMTQNLLLRQGRYIVEITYTGSGMLKDRAP